jgi:hypothetical protein
MVTVVILRRRYRSAITLIHHIAFDTADLDKTIAQWKAAGYTLAQSGDRGEKGTAGWGKFAYIDTDAAGGLTVELLWNYKP